jgi:hypothetical protein
MKTVTFICDPKVVIQEVFKKSHPQGMGFIHYTPNYELSDEEASQFILERNGRIYIDMDYVQGRACKFHAEIVDNCVQMRFDEKRNWYDHSNEAFEELISTCNGVI